MKSDTPPVVGHMLHSVVMVGMKYSTHNKNFTTNSNSNKSYSPEHKKNKKRVKLLSVSF